MVDTKKLSPTESKKILGVSGTNVRTGNFYSDEPLNTLRGRRAITVYRQMRDNDATIGAVMYAAEQMLRDVKYKVKPSDKENEAAVEAARFVEEVLQDMDHSLDDHISEALSFLTYGFMPFEVVYKRRVGPLERDPKKRSKYTDGLIGVRKIAPRAPWTINKFDVDQYSGDVKGFWQTTYKLKGDNYIPMRKAILYRTTSINGDPTGRSILRNAYTSYTRLQAVQQYEAIGIERELAGIPHAEIPSDYLSADASDDQKAFVTNLENILRDLKFNEQGFLITPSDTYPGKDGEPTNQKLVTVRLMASEGSRNIDIDPVVRRYQHDIARSVLFEFLLLGASSTGSYALSKSKGDFALRALEAYVQAIVDCLNKQLVERLWELNGFDFGIMPKIVAGDIAPHDLKELGAYLRNLNGADISLADQVDIVDALLENAELPLLDREVYQESREVKRKVEEAKTNPPTRTPQTEEEEDT